MDQLRRRSTGRQYHLFDYVGAPDAERVIVMMGSGAETAEETVDAPDRARREGRRAARSACTGRSRRSASSPRCPPTRADASPCSTAPRSPAASGEPLYLDVVTALSEALADGGPVARHASSAGATASSSKEFTPAMVKARLRRAAPKPAARTTSPSASTTTSPTPASPTIPTFSIEAADTVRAVFYGLGSDGTVGANKNSIKIIGEETDNYAQGYFVYDSKKSGSVTISHLRFGPQPIHAPYLISQANFVACHQFGFLERFDVLRAGRAGRASSCSTAPTAPTRSGTTCRAPSRQPIIDKRLRFFVIDGNQVAREAGMGGRVNTIMQTCFFAISGVLPRDEAIAAIKHAIEKTYGKRGEAVVQTNFAAVDADARPPASRSTVPAQRRPASLRPAPAGARRGARLRAATSPRQMIAGDGDDLPVSALPVDGTYPDRHHAVGEAQHRRSRSRSGTETLCIQCGKCVLVCPHAVIRAKVYDAGRARRRARRRSSPRRPAGSEFGEHAVHAPGRAGRLHRLRASASRSARPRTRARRATRRSTWRPQPPLRERESGELGLLPRPARDRTATALNASHGQGRRSCCSRSSSSPAPAPAAARRRTSSC